MALCGIDESGRGPIAGPLVVVGCVLHLPIEGLNDSKKLSEKKRNTLYQSLQNVSTYHVVVTEALEIDKKGISKAISNSLLEIQAFFKGHEILFDGNSSFGVEGIVTQIKADESVAEVSAASILAKVIRDEIMYNAAKKFPLYFFEKHKGYGTKLHVEKIKEHGFCAIHRRSYKLKALSELY